MTLLSVSHLTTVFEGRGGRTAAVDDVSFDVATGETLALVGESGSGKSVTALSIMRLVQPPGRVAGGRILFRGRDLLTLPEPEMRRLRGAEISLVFQEPLSALNPVFTIGDQIAETLQVHGRAGRPAALAAASDLLRQVGIPDAAARLRDYPHQLSGGMRQRVLIAAAVACRPALLIADEPTTALDTTIQAQILDLLRSMKERLGLSLLLISHDLGVVAAAADRVAVMYAGRIVEQGPAARLFADPQHPYTRGLLASIPGGAPGRKLATLEGSPASPGDVPAGCAFQPRCSDRMDACGTMPQAYAVGAGHFAHCHLHASRVAPAAGAGQGGAAPVGRTERRAPR